MKEREAQKIRRKKMAGENDWWVKGKKPRQTVKDKGRKSGN